MDEKKFSNYISTVQTLVINKEDFQLPLEELNQLVSKYIENSQEDSRDDEDCKNFFLGELEFFSGNYEQSLQKYSSSINIPLAQFFSHRSHAFIQHIKGDVEESIKFCKKALEVFPEDYSTLKLLQKNCEKIQNTTELQTVSDAIDVIVKKYSKKNCEEQSSESKIALNEDEISKLESMFKESAKSGTDNELEDFEESYKQFEDNFYDDKNAFDAKDENSFDSKHNEFDDSFNIDIDNLDDEENFWNSQQDFVNDHIYDVDFEYSLEEKVNSFKGVNVKKNSLLGSNILLGMHGWDLFNKNVSNTRYISGYFQKMSGGFFIRWKNKGIVINPGMSFLHNFYKNNFSVTDIDIVISTRESIESCSDIKGIFDLNDQQNYMQKKKNPHVINYYLNRQVYRNLLGILSPRFKEERDMLHCLDFYLDSTSENEVVNVNNDISIVYFSPRNTSHLAIKLSLTDGNLKRNIAFLSEISWSSTFASLFKNCDIVIAGFGYTNESDYNKLHYQNNCLGYFGSYSLLESTNPRLFIVTEFDGTQGDIRLEAIKKLRREYLINHPNKNTSIVVNDFDFQCDLGKLKVKCSVCKKFSFPEKVRIARSSEQFGMLQYLCSNCYM